MSRVVSGNREVQRMRDYTVLLRAVSTPVAATTMLYLAAAMLTPGRNREQRASNGAVLELVARMLDLPIDEPEVVERVLRNLPPE